MGYEVGQLYHRNRTQWPQAAEYDYRGGRHELVIFIPDLEEREIEALTVRGESR